MPQRLQPQWTVGAPCGAEFSPSPAPLPTKLSICLMVIPLPGCTHCKTNAGCLLAKQFHAPFSLVFPFFLGSAKTNFPFLSGFNCLWDFMKRPAGVPGPQGYPRHVKAKEPWLHEHSKGWQGLCLPPRLRPACCTPAFPQHCL